LIAFLAALSGTNTAAKCLSISADGDGKLTLEFDASQLTSVLPILALSGQAFRVTVEPA